MASRRRSKRKPGEYGGTKLTAEQHAARLAFREWFCTDAFPRAMEGVVYEPAGSVDFAAELRILRCSFVAWDLERAKQVAEQYLRAPDVYLVHQGRPLSILGRQIHHWASATARRLKGKADPHERRHRPTAAERGEHEHPHRELKSLRLAAAPGPAVPRAG